MSAKVVLHDKATKSIARQHPWIFSGAVKSVKGNPADGDILKLVFNNGDFAGRGYWNTQSQIRVRVISWDEHKTIDSNFWTARIKQAISTRPATLSCRLINAENDYLPGLIVDRYGDWLVLQALTLGIDRRKTMFAEILADLLQPHGIYERSDVDIRSKEGLPECKGILWGEAPPQFVEIEENGLRWLVDVVNGQKTGFYLDQRKNRAALQTHLSSQPVEAKKIVLNAFSYTGGFSLAALAGGAEQVISIDSSETALELAYENVKLNGFMAKDDDFIIGDVFEVLRYFRQQGQQFDCIILDPPKFARHSRQVESATRGYKDINWLAFQLLKPGGHLWTFSCSNAISTDLFQKVVFGALIDANRQGQIIQRLTATADHPIALTFPEGEYLKGLVCQVW